MRLHKRADDIRIHVGVGLFGSAITIELWQCAAAHCQLNVFFARAGFYNCSNRLRIEHVLHPGLRNTAPQALQVCAGMAVRLSKDNVGRRNAGGICYSLTQLVLYNITCTDGIQHQKDHFLAVGEIVRVRLLDN